MSIDANFFNSLPDASRLQPFDNFCKKTNDCFAIPSFGPFRTTIICQNIRMSLKKIEPVFEKKKKVSTFAPLSSEGSFQKKFGKENSQKNAAGLALKTLVFLPLQPVLKNKRKFH